MLIVLKLLYLSLLHLDHLFLKNRYLIPPIKCSINISTN
uniref:Uncharacterized protein n=1 Tax=Myoviridae sp. ctZ2t4 TaxID=2827693 RepID=A0A8S5SSZ4_9CAUD|nr:MAG TPA: hypothetical protein [Myoviridae sp. ctZ2t4]